MQTRIRTAAVMGSLLSGSAFAQDAPKRNEVPPPRTVSASRPFGTQRELAAMQQLWLKKRLDTFVPGLMRKQGIDFWVITMREYNEDPVFNSITARNAGPCRSISAMRRRLR